ncbi:MAG: type pullulanase [Clostridia bacterium]|nr:type pullulanase [Clostridia bacterium]
MYIGNDLGANYSKAYTTFKVWSPAAKRLKVVIYNEYFEEFGIEHDMFRLDNGIWELKLEGNYGNRYYNYRVTVGNTERETPDPYAKGASINGNRGMIVDFESTNPRDWDYHSIPSPIKPTESILYEVHIRDFSIDSHSGITNKGKYLAFTEEGTKGVGNISTGVDHLKELGITHVHLLPAFDFESVDERLDRDYNWGYDPYLYNVLEGSYASNPYDGNVRITEFKEMIMKLHTNNIRVVMDMVFNHTFSIEDSPFNILVPGYYYRFNADGTYSNGSGCGNEVASEKPMVRKFIVDCVKFWAKEYKIDGFRFDLMALMDIETISEIKRELKIINPYVLIYGEPWTGGNSVLDHGLQFRKGSQKGMQIGIFNDEFRNAIKGDNDGRVLGFVNGAQNLECEIRKGIAGSITYNEILCGFAQEPSEVINYVSSHDNLTLFDKIMKTSFAATDLEREMMNRLALSIILTSQGIAFIHGGSEILRSKKGNHNSYSAGDEINKIDWSTKSKYIEMFKYMKGLIDLRKSQKVMTMEKSEDIIENLHFIDSPQNTVAYLLNSTYENNFRHIFIIHNANRQEISINAPLPGAWKVIANGREANLKGIRGGETMIDLQVKVPPLSTYILGQ